MPAHHNAKDTRPCIGFVDDAGNQVDCVKEIPALGNKTRCLSCAGQAYRTRRNAEKRKARAARSAAKPEGGAT